MQQPDHFKQSSDGDTYAGDHLLLDFYDAQNLSDVDLVRNALEASATAAGATILHSHCHRFGGGGVSGVTVLAESHITIHTWPERAYAAIDIFMCGECNPDDCLAALEAAFEPQRTAQHKLHRGQATEAAQDVA